MNEIETWQILQTFIYPHEAHVASTFLESEGITTEIRDELTAQVNNFYSTAIGGVKILVKEEDFNRGIEVLKKGGYINEIDHAEEKIEFVYINKDVNTKVCPFCKSENISIKKEPNIWTVLVIFVFNAAVPIFKKSYKCYDCEKAWKYKKNR
ncbi:MAG: putative signal transducing protein [Prolixibacteraceae bacterium]